jgi:hypothetical protein
MVTIWARGNGKAHRPSATMMGYISISCSPHGSVLLAHRGITGPDSPDEYLMEPTLPCLADKFRLSVSNSQYVTNNLTSMHYTEVSKVAAIEWKRVSINHVQNPFLSDRLYRCMSFFVCHNLAARNLFECFF